jgi:predicted benzoate:H+ symporter BenE
VAGFGYIKPIGPSIVHALLAGVLLSFESAAARSHDAGFGFWWKVGVVVF